MTAEGSRKRPHEQEPLPSNSKRVCRDDSSGESTNFVQAWESLQPEAEYCETLKDVCEGTQTGKVWVDTKIESFQKSVMNYLKSSCGDSKYTVEDTSRETPFWGKCSLKPDITLREGSRVLEADKIVGFIELKVGEDNENINLKHAGQVLQYMLALREVQRCRTTFEVLLVFPKTARLFRMYLNSGEDGVRVQYGPRIHSAQEAVRAYLSRTDADFGYVKHGDCWGRLIGSGATSSVFEVRDCKHVVKLVQECLVENERTMHNDAYTASPNTVLPLLCELPGISVPDWYQRNRMIVMDENVGTLRHLPFEREVVLVGRGTRQDSPGWYSAPRSPPTQHRGAAG